MQSSDTDHMTILERGGVAAYPLQIRLRQVPVEEIATTIVNYEEQVRGWLSRISQAKTPEQSVAAYKFLQLNLERYCVAKLLDYDQLASDNLVRLRQTQVRLGTQDLKIAAICLANNATLLSRNLKDSGQVPGLIVEDRSQ